MEDLERKIKELEKKEVYLKTQFEVFSQEKSEKESQIKELTKKKELCSNSLKLLKEVSENCQQKTVKQIETIITQLYQYVFNSTDEVVIELDIKRANPEAHIFIKTKKDGTEILLDPVEEDGGGKVDIISLGLRVAGLLLFKPALNRVLILDEPLKDVSTSLTSAKAYRQRTAEFLKTLCADYGIQIIIVTHEQDFIEVADTKYILESDTKGYSHIC